MMKTNLTRSSKPESDESKEQRLIAVEGFAFDLVAQLYELRLQRGLSQKELAELANTRQQVISRMESAGYDRHALSHLRRVAEGLGAYIDVVLVPQERLGNYLEWRYQPIFFEAPPVEKWLESATHSVSSADVNHAEDTTVFTTSVNQNSWVTGRQPIRPAKYTGHFQTVTYEQRKAA